MQVEFPNHSKVLYSKDMVLSVRGKGNTNCQVCIKEMNESKPLAKHRKGKEFIKTRVLGGKLG